VDFPGGVAAITGTLVRPFVHGHVEEKVGIEAEDFIIEGVVDDELKGRPLLGGADDFDGGCVTGIALAVAVDMGSADPVGHHGDHAELHAEGDGITAAGVGPAFAILDELVEDAVTVMIDEAHLVLGVVEGILGEVVAAGEGIGAPGVIIGEIGEFGIGDAFEGIFRILAVAVFDGEVVVGADVDHGEVALDFPAFHVEVGGVVVHDGVAVGLFAFPLFAVDLSEGVNAGGLEVVAESEGVADFMGDEVGEEGADEPLGDAVEELIVVAVSVFVAQAFFHPSSFRG